MKDFFFIGWGGRGVEAYISDEFGCQRMVWSRRSEIGMII